MKKRIIIGNLIAIILFVLEIVLLNYMMIKLGTIAYILIDVLIVAVIFFIINYLVNKNGNLKICIINAIILMLLYITISNAYARTPYGMQANETLDMMTLSENQDLFEESGLEITFSDADVSSQVINYGFYLAAAFIGGQTGFLIKKKQVIESNVI